MIKSIFSLLFVFILASCTTTNDTKQNSDEAQSVKLSYAKRFTIKKATNYTVLELLGNRNNAEVTATFVLYTNEKPANFSNAYYIKIPVTKIASMSSIYTTMLEKLNARNSIVAIDNADYYSNEFIQQQVKTNKIVELSKGPKMDIERTLALKPDLMLTFGMGNPKNDIDQKLLNANLPVAITLDHLEETPLARYEWIKFVACFVGKEAMADSLFSTTEKKYNEFKALTKNVTSKPKVLTEIKYGDAWYVPSGKSYMSNLIADAGAEYLWSDNNSTGSTPLTFEAVYAKAKDCDVWINTYNVNSKKELLSYDERYGLFKAFKDGRIYNNNKIQNANGFSNYWETGMTSPDEVLADLIFAFHPDLLPNYSFKFYKKIE